MTLITWIKQHIAIRTKQRQLNRINEHIHWLEDQVESGQLVLRQYRDQRAIVSAQLNVLLPPDQIVRDAGLQA